MGLDVWFRQDVARILASTQETLALAQKGMVPLDGERSAAYREGFADALQAVAVAFGLRRPGAGPGAGQGLTTWREQCLAVQVWGDNHRGFRQEERK